MDEYGLTAEDVKSALTNGQIEFHELKQDLLWRVKGRDIDGRALQVQVAVYQEEIAVKVITVMP
jgi:hypothetical protein